MSKNPATIKANMVNSESRSPNDQVPPSTCSPHEDGCEEAVNKLAECMSTVPMMKEFGTKGLTEAFKASAFHAEDNYIKGGACKESFMALAECPDRDKPDKQAAMLDCMQGRPWAKVHKARDLGATDNRYFRGIKNL